MNPGGDWVLVCFHPKCREAAQYKRVLYQERSYILEEARFSALEPI